MTRKEISGRTIKRLYSLSGNQCAFPDCKQELFNNEGGNISHICHIEAAKEGGPRYNSQSNDEHRRSFENLILLCLNHHKETDNEELYTAEKLKEMKQIHQNKVMLSKDIFIENPSILNEVVNLIGTQLHFEEQDESKSAPNIEEKIKYNDVKRYKLLIEEHKVYQGKLNTIYKEIERSDSRKKMLLLQSVRNFYLEERGKYEHIQGNADNILDSVKEKIYQRITTTKLPIEAMELAILIIIVDAFMRCKILEEPK